jgi:competence protein ComEC
MLNWPASLRLWRHRGLQRVGVRRWIARMLAAAALGFGCTGLRCLAYDHQALSPALEGRDVLVKGVVTDLPQRNEAGLRFNLAVDSAALDDRAIAVPPKIDLAWYGGSYSMEGEQLSLQRSPGDVRAGERWRLLVRLKAHHGSRNLHGFDYELWLWERGVQAGAYVRAGSADPEPQRLAQTWLHPVAWLRQSVRERIASHIEQRPFAGLIAALVVGDQNAIDRWRITSKS